MSKNRLKRGERSNTYLTHVCKLPWSVQSLERIDKKLELSVNTVAFICCRSRLTITLAGAARGKWGWGEGSRVSSSILATCPAHLNLLDLITLTIIGEQYKL